MFSSKRSRLKHAISNGATIAIVVVVIVIVAGGSYAAFVLSQHSTTTTPIISTTSSSSSTATTKCAQVTGTNDSFVAQAEAQGSITIWGTLPTNDITAEANLFSQDCPGISVQFTKYSAGALLNKISAAVSTGTYGYDLVNDNWGDMAAMTAEGAFSNYNISEYHTYSSNGLTGPNVTEPFLRAVVFSILYSKNLPSNEVPTSNVSSILNQAFSGKIAFVGPSKNPGTTYWFAGVNQTYFGGNGTKTKTFIQDLAGLSPTYVSDYSTAAADVVSGQDLVAVAYTQYIISQAACSCLAYVAMNPFLAQPSLMSLSAKPTHQLAAALFLDFVYSQAGGSILASQGEYAYYPGVAQNATLNWQSSYKVNPTPFLSNASFTSLQSLYESYCSC